MCEPITMGLLLGAGSFVASSMAQKNAAEAQQKQQERASRAENQRLAKQFSSMRAQEGAEQRAAAVELQKSQQLSYEAFGQAAAIDNGVTGNSLAAIQDSYLQALGQERSGVYNQLAENNIQRDFAFDSASSQSAMNQININQPIQRPDYLGNAIGGLSTGLSAYGAATDLGFGNKTPKSTVA